jgi:hypothetical protein
MEPSFYRQKHRPIFLAHAIAPQAYLFAMTKHILPQLHLVKLAAGLKSLEELELRQDAMRQWALDQGYGDKILLDTKNRPKRESEMAGASIYWIFAGAIQCRQAILGLHDATGLDGKPRCVIDLDHRLVQVRQVPRKPFQGWRYLVAANAPADIDREDLEPGGDLSDMPEEMRRELEKIGIL